MTTATPDVIFHNGRITTLDRSRPRASAVAVKDGRFVAVGDDAECWRWPAPARGAST